MIKIGQFNFLKIIRKTARGTFLDAGPLGQVYLPVSQTPSHVEAGDKIQVFLYRDSQDEVVGTTHKPRVELGGVASLKVVSVNQVGAFLDWGLPKDLFVPFGEQSKKMAEGEYHIVSVYEDNTGRICGSSKLNKFLTSETRGLKNGQPVNVIVGDITDLGYKMVVNQKYWGVLHKNDVFRELRYGQTLKGFVKKVRADSKIDITLSKPSAAGTHSLSDKILAKLNAEDGFCELNDKSAPELIYQVFGVSKKVFKAEIGALYKQKKITIEKDGIRLAGG